MAKNTKKALHPVARLILDTKANLAQERKWLKTAQKNIPFFRATVTLINLFIVDTKKSDVDQSLVNDLKNVRQEFLDEIGIARENAKDSTRRIKRMEEDLALLTKERANKFAPAKTKKPRR